MKHTKLFHKSGGHGEFRVTYCEKHTNYGQFYRGADKSLARPDWRKQFKDRHFSSDAEVIAAAETWLDGQSSEYFW